MGVLVGSWDEAKYISYKWRFIHRGVVNSACENKKIVSKNIHALKWAQFEASKYLLFVKVKPIDQKISKLLNNSNNFQNDVINEAKINHDTVEFEKIQKQYFMDGTNGIVVSDPKISSDTFKLEFNTKNCNIVKKILDTNYEMMYDLVIK